MAAIAGRERSCLPGLLSVACLSWRIDEPTDDEFLLPNAVTFTH
jgi:hypothetical protein